jgi:hypothetical protein
VRGANRFAGHDAFPTLARIGSFLSSDSRACLSVSSSVGNSQAFRFAFRTRFGHDDLPLAATRTRHGRWTGPDNAIRQNFNVQTGTARDRLFGFGHCQVSQRKMRPTLLALMLARIAISR